jgi:hypothetical protein
MRSRFLCAGALTLLALSWVGTAHAKEPGIYPLAKVRRGQKGHGLTTFSGTQPERWEFEVIGVMENFRPKMSVILVKSDDPKLEVNGFWRGMSGSPLFIDGKLACAFSYGFQFNKKAIGGCTPIEVMIEEGLHSPVRGILEEHAPGTPHGAGKGRRADAGAPGPARAASLRAIRPGPATRSEWASVAPGGDAGAALAQLGAPREPWLMRAPLPPAATATARDTVDPSGLVPSAIPLAISGFTGPAFEEARRLMAPYAVEPMQGGGTGNGSAGPTAFALGGPIAVQLVRGDVSFAGTGTVSYLSDGRVLAFGHPFFEQGEFYAPVSAAEIHAVIPSAVSGFVLASPLRELGSLVQDRLPAIMADTRLRNRMIPMSVYVEAGTGARKQTGEFHAELVNNRFLTGALASLIALNAVTRFLPDRDHATVTMESRVSVRGKQPLQFTDYLYASDGATSVIGGARGLRVLIPLLFNPFSPVDIDRIEIRFKLSFDTNYGNITELRLPRSELEPGKRNHVDVVMTRFDDTEVVERIPFDVPARLAGAIVKLEVTPGDAATIDAAPAESLDDLLATFGKLLPGNVFAVTLFTADEGVAIRGKIVRDLPPSAVDRFHPESRSQRAAVYRPFARSVAPSKRVLNGSGSMLVKVADPDRR